MTFLNPVVLFGLIAAGIPLVIHLFNFRRPRRVDFSSLVFLKELQQTTMQRVRIKQWLLLLLRTLAIAALVLAFARPALEGSIAGAIGGDAESAVAVVVDNSMSMTLRDENGVLFEQARDLARELVGLMRAGDQLAVFKTVGASEATAPVWFKTRQAVLDFIDSTEPAFGRSDLAASIRQAREYVDASGFVNREVFVISDLQLSTLGDATLDADAGSVPVRLVQVGSRRATPNASVDAVEVVSQIVEQNQPVNVRATISSSGSGEHATIASVFLEGERVAQATATLTSDAPALVEFAVTPRDTGWLRGEVRVEDDDFMFDNTRYFSLFVPDRRNILLVKGQAFRSNYLELVVSSRLAPGRTRFDVSVIQSRELSSAALADFDVVIIAGAESFSSGEISLISDYAREGGGVLLFPPAVSSSADFGDVLDALDGGNIQTLVEGSPGQPVAEIEFVDLDHPLFEGVFDTGGREEVQVERTEVFRYVDYVAQHPAEQTLMRLSTGRPFLQEMRPGSGRVLFISTLPEPAWSMLPVRGLFVPLLFRSLHYLSSGDDVTGGEVIVGKSLDVRISRQPAGAPVAGRTDGIDFVPAQRTVFGGTLVTLGEEFRAPGIAELFVGQDLVRRVAVNADPTESDLRTVGADEAAQGLGGDDAGVRALQVG
ncbi:MAG: BatA domain-containing protein, partial [Rhodothermales bacterium]|nr:BatA domain-containing protein [Rhodothermales bacterium]